MCIRGRARRERSGLRQQQRAQHRKNRVTRRDVTLAKSRNFQIHGSCNQRTLAATSESAQPVLGRRAGCMHRASTCRTHPPAALPCQMSAWAVRACDSNHVCTGGKQKVPCTRRSPASCCSMAFLHRPYCLYVCHRNSEHAHAMFHVVNAMGRVVVLLCLKEVDTGDYILCCCPYIHSGGRSTARLHSCEATVLTRDNER